MAAQKPGGELEVVVPQEVVRPRQAAPAAHPGVNEDRDERGRTDRHAARRCGRQAFCLAGKRLAAWGVHRVRSPVGPDHAAGDQRGGVARVAFAGRQQRQQRARLGHRVVVHEPDEVRAAGQGQRRAVGEPARAAGVARQLGQPDRRVVAAHRRGGPVGRGVVDHDHGVRRPALATHRGERLEQQLPPVAGDHNRDHAGTGDSGHVRDVPVGWADRRARAPGGAQATARPRCAAGARPGRGC